jgi:hypothetical protein
VTSWQPASTGSSRTQPEDRLLLVRYAAKTAAIGVVLGLVGGAVWAAVASPPAALRTSTGLILGETQLDQQFGVTMAFLVTGVIVGVLVGLAVCWKGATYGVLAVAAAVAAAVIGCFLSYWSGVHLFGPGSPGALTAHSGAQRVVVQLSVDTDAAYLGWPVGSLLGAVAAISAWPRQRANSPARGQGRPATHRAGDPE